MYLDNIAQEKNLLQWCLKTPGVNLAQVKTLCNVVLEAQDNITQEKLCSLLPQVKTLCNVVWQATDNILLNKSCAMLSKHIWLLQMLYQHLANIAQEKSQASIEQKDKIVWNNDIVATCMLNLINLYCSHFFHVPVFIIYQLFLPYHILYMLLFLSIHKGFSF